MTELSLHIACVSGDSRETARCQSKPKMGQENWRMTGVREVVMKECLRFE